MTTYGPDFNGVVRTEPQRSSCEPTVATLYAVARAFDKEDAAQRGEPDPWIDGGDDAVWVSERLACAQVALEALAASSAAPVQGKAQEDAIRAAKPIIEALIAQEYNVETWGLKSRLAAIDAALLAGDAKAGAVEGEAATLIALRALLHAVCGETGFANAVRVDSGRAYPWPDLDEAEALAIEAIMEATDAKYR